MAVPAHLPATADAGRHHSAGGARRLCRRRQQRRRRDRNPVGAGQSQITDALAQRGGGRDACMAAQFGAHRVRCGAGCCVGMHRLDVLRAPRRPESDRRLHRRPDGQGAARADAPRDQPHEGGAARFRLRRPRALLDLPRAHRARLVRPAFAGVPGKRDARQHRRAAERAARLPDQARALYRRHAAIEVRQHGAGRRRDRGGGFGRRREDARRDVRRPARFHAAVGEAAAVRHRLCAQRVFRRRRRRDQRARRLDRQVPR